MTKDTRETGHTIFGEARFVVTISFGAGLSIRAGVCAMSGIALASFGFG
jgi:hypothetical protein